jgi:hypothetical protein
MTVYEISYRRNGIEAGFSLHFSWCPMLIIITLLLHVCLSLFPGVYNSPDQAGQYESLSLYFGGFLLFWLAFG